VRYAPRSSDLWQETQELQRVLAAPTFLSLRLEPMFAAPLSPPDGMIVYADGAVWNPGAGEGVYVYYAAAWNLLG